MPALLHEPLSADVAFFNADHNPPPSPSLADAVAYALQMCPGFNFLPSNYDSHEALAPGASSSTAHFSCDDFRIYEFKVRRCMRGRSHDWTECPFAHPGEKARRRDPRRIHYSGAPCPDFRKGSCRRGDACEFAHGVFECWLHPARYRTQVCKDGKNCKRRVCFFAHSPEQLRILPVSMAYAPTSAHPHINKADGPSVGPPRGLMLSGKGSFDSIPSQEVAMSASAGMLRGYKFLSTLSSSSSASSPMTPPSSSQVSPVSKHLDSSNVSTLRRAMMQNILACKGYGVNLNAAEYSSMPDSYDALPEAQLMSSFYPGLQSNHRNMFSKLSLPSEQKCYDLMNYSHGFGSPTSTLEGNVFSPPPLSPPLSPLTSPSSEIKDSFTNTATDFHTFFADNAVTHNDITELAYAHDDLTSLDGLGFRLQNLQLIHSNDGACMPQSLNAMVQGGQDSHFLQQSRRSSFGHVSSNLSCTSKQALWGISSDLVDSELGELSQSQARDAYGGHDFGVSKAGEESINADNLIPDFDWVSELVK